MTATAITDGSRVMAVLDQGPGRSAAVTGVALLCRGNVAHRLVLSILRNIATVVTSRALPAQTSMVHNRWRPGLESCRVTGIALRRRLDMAIWLAKRVG